RRLRGAAPPRPAGLSGGDRGARRDHPRAPPRPGGAPRRPDWAGSTAMHEPRADRHLAFHALAEALAQPGCPICRLARASASRALDALAYELVNDLATHAAFREALGLCARHGWEWLEMPSSGQGAAILYRAVVRAARARLDRPRAAPPARRGLLARLLGRAAGGPAAERAALTPQHPCPICRARDGAAERALAVLLDHLAAADVQAAYAGADGLCLPHLRQALGRADRARGALLVEQAARRLDALEDDLSEYIRKHDYRFRDEPYGAERDAPERGVARFAGERGVW